MDWQTPEDSSELDFITDTQLRALLGKPPVTGAWRHSDPVGNRCFAKLGTFYPEFGGEVPGCELAYETFGELDPQRSNAVLVFHAFTGDSHVAGAAGAGHVTAGWWEQVVGPHKALDTTRYFVICINILGGCQGSTGPASPTASGACWGSDFPYLTIRDQVRACHAVTAQLGLTRFAAVIGGSMGGMHALEWALLYPAETARLAVLAAPAQVSAAQLGLNLVQLDAILSDANYRDGKYYDLPAGQGPHRGLATARRLALLSYRGDAELNTRFGRAWQSGVSPLGAGGRFAVESYLDFHGNKFTRRFDAGSYVTLLQAMNSHDVGRDRGGVTAALQRLTMPTLVLGITTDRLFPLETQQLIAAHAPGSITGTAPAVLHSPYGHDAFLIEHEAVGLQLQRLLGTAAAGT